MASPVDLKQANVPDDHAATDTLTTAPHPNAAVVHPLVRCDDGKPQDIKDEILEVLDGLPEEQRRDAMYICFKAPVFVQDIQDRGVLVIDLSADRILEPKTPPVSEVHRGMIEAEKQRRQTFAIRAGQG